MTRICRRAALLTAAAALAAGAAGAQTATPSPAQPPKVAVLLDDWATMIDFSGFWQALGDTQNDTGFDIYSVASKTGPLKIYNGLTVNAQFTYDNAPQPDILFMGAQWAGRSGSPADKIAWVQRVHAATRLTVSACNGAFILAQAGLLDGLKATTHHKFIDEFRSKYPKVDLVTDRRVVPQGKIVTAGGECCSLDLGLWVVDHIYGRDTAASTAAYMEYEGTGWKV